MSVYGNVRHGIKYLKDMKTGDTFYIKDILAILVGEVVFYPESNEWERVDTVNTGRGLSPLHVVTPANVELWVL